MNWCQDMGDQVVNGGRRAGSMYLAYAEGKDHISAVKMGMLGGIHK